MRTLTVSRATAGFVTRGHPWVRPDRFTRGLERLTPGEAVTLIGQDGAQLASALADPHAAIAARVYAARPNLPFDPAAAIQAAWLRRDGLHRDPGTDCYRIVHGEADHLPGLRVERYADVLVVLVLADCIVPAIDPICAALAGLMPTATVVIRDHRQDLRRGAPTTRRWGGGDIDAEAVVEGRELGVRFPLRPFAGLATGIYVDQRATRIWLRQRAVGKRVLNLFAYTGAFSISLLAAGARSAIDVDLSAPSLARAREAAESNGVADRHAIAHGDCAEILANSSDDYDVIIVDPPTAAQGGGGGGWILRRDYPRLLTLAAKRLAPGGTLIAACNTVGGKPFDLRATVRGAAQESGIRLDVIGSPRLDDDIPQMRGFPEGRPFELIAATRT